MSSGIAGSTRTPEPAGGIDQVMGGIVGSGGSAGCGTGGGFVGNGTPVGGVTVGGRVTVGGGVDTGGPGLPLPPMYADWAYVGTRPSASSAPAFGLRRQLDQRGAQRFEL